MSDPTNTRAGQSAGSPGDGEFIDATDNFGRRVRLSRDEYRSRVLPEMLKTHGNDPAQLSQVIVQGLQHGFAKDLVQAANRLAAIDSEPERALSLLSVVQRDAGDLEAARFSLDELQNKRPDSVGARVGKAMLADRAGDTATAETLLFEALGLDPNNPDAVHGWLQVRLKEVGEAGTRAELDKLAELPNAWRAQLWLARLDLQEEKAAVAAERYRAQLAANADSPAISDVLLMAATDLVNARQHDLVQELVEPRFTPGRDHPNVGLALLNHLAATGRHADGAALLHRMYVHYGHAIAEQLHPFTGEFDRQRLAALPQVAPPAQPRVGMFRFELPAFCSALGEPQWLLPQKQPGHKQVLVVALALDGDIAKNPNQQPPEDIARLTRAVPLHLAEQVWLATPHRGTAALPVAENGGWALLGRPWSAEQITAQLPDQERSSTLLVTGALRVEGDRRRIELTVFDSATKARTGDVTVEGGSNDVGQMLLDAQQKLWPLLGGPADHKPPVGDAAFWQRYADGLGQHAALVATAAGAMPKERLYGERYIVHWLQTTALQEPRWQPGFWTLASALCVLQQLGSDIPKEHARIVAEIFRQSPPNSPFARLGILPLRAVGLEAQWQARREEIRQANAQDQAYLDWLQRIEAAIGGGGAPPVGGTPAGG